MLRLGILLLVLLKKVEPRREIQKGMVVRCLVVRQKKPFRRKDGTYIRFDENACVILKREKDIYGTRIFGPIPREIKELGYNKIANLAVELV